MLWAKFVYANLHLPLLSKFLSSNSSTYSKTHILTAASYFYLLCEGHRPDPGLLALSSWMAGTGLVKRWQKQNMAQTSTPEGPLPSWDTQTHNTLKICFTQGSVRNILLNLTLAKPNIVVCSHIMFFHSCPGISYHESLYQKFMHF